VLNFSEKVRSKPDKKSSDEKMDKNDEEKKEQNEPDRKDDINDKGE